MEYNTNQKSLPLPEYGRSVQKMVDHALTIKDRSERQRCAQTIVKIMESMFPNLRNELPDYKRKLWDHLAIMSNFMLDIDYPYEVIKKEAFTEPPTKISYKKSEIKNKHYGRIVENMIAHACTMQEGEERDYFVNLILVQMKKNYTAWNKDGVEDKRIIEDLKIISGGKIDSPVSEIRISTSNTQKPFRRRKKVITKRNIDNKNTQ
ncbi:MAG: DUF4290 domain-containing protein [Bacteroidaceae bacterium]|nr:DUF4290 domain-containing protein [Bacteroidaceae bacterium]